MTGSKRPADRGRAEAAPPAESQPPAESPPPAQSPRPDPWAVAALERARDSAYARLPHLLLGSAVAGLALAPVGGHVVLAAACAVFAVALLPLGAGRAAIAASLLVIGGVVGAARIAAIDRPAHAAPAGAAIDAEATLLERPRRTTFGSSAVMRIDSGPAAGLRVLARRREARWLRGDPGTRFRLRGLVKAPAAGGRARSSLYGIRISEANAGRSGTPGFGPLPARAEPGAGFDYAAFLRSRGIGRQLEVESLVPIGRRGGAAGAVDAIRTRAERGISAHLSAGHAALARGMVLGEDGDIDPATRDDFRRAGLAHLVAASGQNVALLCALVLPLLVLSGASSRVRVVVLLPVVGLYVAIAGAGASVTRAGVMAAAALVALGLGRLASAGYALLLAALVTLVLNPRSPADPGWQLSFAAVIGMLWLGSPVQRRLGRLPRPVAEAAAASLAATIATAPLLAHSFGAVSIAALPANLAAFPAVAPIMWIGMAQAALEQTAALGGVAESLAHALEAVSAPADSLALAWIEAVARRFGDPPWSQAHLSLGWVGVAGAYAGLMTAAWLVRRARRRSPIVPGGAGGVVLDWLRALSPASRRALAAPLVALAMAAAAHAAEAPRAPHALTVDFIDIGQGDSTLIRDPTGAAVLFDGGIPAARVDRILERLGVRRLSVVVATHQSRDHTGGLLQVVRRFPVGLFLDGRYGVDDPSFIALEREVDRRRIPRRPTQRGERLRVGGMTIRILWPPPRGNDPPPADPNTRATVAIVSEGGFSLLLSADAEAPVLLPLDLPRVTAMKVPHHGSAEDGLPELLDRLRPRVAAIECGRGNPFAHPRPSTLRALRAVPLVYRTDRDGTVELTVQAGRIAIRTHR